MRPRINILRKVEVVQDVVLVHAHMSRFCRSERLAKYNQLLRIEEELGSEAVYAGENWRHISW